MQENKYDYKFITDAPSKDNLEQTSLLARDESNKGWSKNKNVYCFFINSMDLNYDESDFDKSWENDDVKIILPLNWNIVVVRNVVTISNENSESVHIIFQHTPTVTYECEKSSTSVEKNFEQEGIISSGNIKKRNILHSKHSARMGKDSHIDETDTTTNSLVNLKSVGKEGTCGILPPEQPLLLEYTERNKWKQILICKACSFQNVLGSKNSLNMSETIEKMLKRSVPYEGVPIYLIFNPKKVIQTLKKKEKLDDGLIYIHSSEARHDLTNNLSHPNTPRNKFFQSANNHTSNRSTITRVMSLDSLGSRKSNISFNHRDIKCKHDSNTALRKSFSISAVKNERITSSWDYPEDKPKLKIYRRKKSRTALKRVNVRQIVSSVFRHFFHSYSLLGGHLKSGAVITRSNSNHWLKVSGVATDSFTLRLAGELFTDIAGRKVVLNIYDYLQFLKAFAYKRRIIVAELVKQMMVHDQSYYIEEQNVKTKKLQRNEKSNVCSCDTRLRISRSLPDLRSDA